MTQQLQYNLVLLNESDNNRACLNTYNETKVYNPMQSKVFKLILSCNRHGICPGLGVWYSNHTISNTHFNFSIA